MDVWMCGRVYVQNFTTVVIAHRLSTIRHADMIAVLDKGIVQETGTYDELLAKEGGLFHELAARQEALKALDKATMNEADAATGHKPGPDANGEHALPAGGAAEDATAVDAKGSGADGGAEAVEAGEEKAPIGRLVAMQRDHALHLILMVLCSTAACIGPSVAFYFMTEVMVVLYDSDPKRMRDDSLYWAGILGILAASTTLLFTCSGFFNGSAGAALTVKLRALSFGSFVKQDIGFFDIDTNSAAELTAFLAEKVDKVKTITTEQLDLIAQLLGGLGSFLVIILWKCSWQLFLTWCAILPVFGLVMKVEMMFISGSSEDENKKSKGKAVTSKRSQVDMHAHAHRAHMYAHHAGGGFREQDCG